MLPCKYSSLDLPEATKMTTVNSRKNRVFSVSPRKNVKVLSDDVSLCSTANTSISSVFSDDHSLSSNNDDIGVVNVRMENKLTNETRDRRLLIPPPIPEQSAPAVSDLVLSSTPSRSNKRATTLLNDQRLRRSMSAVSSARDTVATQATTLLKDRRLLRSKSAVSSDRDTAATDSPSSKLEVIKACRSARENLLRNLNDTRSPSKRKNLLRDMFATTSTTRLSSSPPPLELEATTADIEERLSVAQKVIEQQRKHIAHWKKEAKDWKIRFEAAWNDRHSQSDRLRKEVEYWKQKAKAAEADLQVFKDRRVAAIPIAKPEEEHQANFLQDAINRKSFRGKLLKKASLLRCHSQSK